MYQFSNVFYATVRMLSPAEQGEILRAVMEYSVSGKEPDGLSIMGNIVFGIAKDHIDSGREKKSEDEGENSKKRGWPKKGNKDMTARECGKLGGRPRKAKEGDKV